MMTKTRPTEYPYALDSRQHLTVFEGEATYVADGVPSNRAVRRLHSASALEVRRA